MRLLALLLTLLAGCSGCASVPLEQVHGATLRADFDNGVCSATAVGSTTVLIATHCLKDGTLKTLGGRDVKILGRRDDGKDHSLIRLNIAFDHWARFGVYPAIGQDVFYYGNPLGLADVLRKGYIAAYVEGEFLIDIEGAPGDSGAAVFDSEGRVIGVISMILQGTPTNFRMMAIFPLAFTPQQIAGATA